MQSHRHREELWVVLDGSAAAEIDGVKFLLNRGERIFVRKGAKHRLYSVGDKVRLLEISFGAFDEEDIVRYEDDFGRS